MHLLLVSRLVLPSRCQDSKALHNCTNACVMFIRFSKECPMLYEERLLTRL